MSKTEISDASASPDVKPEQGVNAPAEKPPTLTLLESGQNPGEILRAAREKAGYSLSEVSAQTKINEKQLEAIESGDVGRLPPETFAKAFIKSYCKALKMDSAPIIASFGFSGTNPQPRMPRSGQSESAKNEPFEPQMPSSSKRLSSLNFDRKSGKKSLSYGIVLAAVAVMAVFYIPVFMSTQDAETTNGVVIEPNEAPATTLGAEEAAIVEPLNDGSLPLALDAPAAVGDTSIFPALQQPSGSVSAPSASTTGATNDAPAGPTKSSVAAPAALPTPATPVGPTQSSVAAPAGPTKSSVAAPAALPTPAAPVGPTQSSIAAASQGTLSFKFQEQSWVTVRDGNDQVLVSQLNDGGTSLKVSGQPPFKLIVGNAQAVSVSSNGKAVDLSSSIRGEVARVTVE